MLHQAGFLAQKRLARGLRLNYPEAVALIATQLLELIRDGRSRRRADGPRPAAARPRRGACDGVAEHDRRGAGRRHVPRRHQARHRAPSDRRRARRPRARALRQLPARRRRRASFGAAGRRRSTRPPGERDRRRRRDRAQRRPRDASTLAVTNRGDRPIQVGSHYHFVETNRALDFDRAAAYGMRLDIPAGTAVRFEPGETKTVTLVAIAGARVIRGGNASPTAVASRRPRVGDRRDARTSMSRRIDRRTTPTSTARRPATASASATPASSPRSSATPRVYGDECKFGGGKVLRDGMGQARRRRRRRRARLRHHQRADRRLDRHLQGRRRHQERPHRRHRQGRQPGRDGRRRRRA